MNYWLRITVIVGVLFFVPSISAYTELSPGVYEQMQSDAPDYFIIRVETVQTPLALFTREKPVIITATILEVLRSAKSETIGQTITIQYIHYKAPRQWVGPRSIPILRRGQRYHAFLTWSDTQGYYLPAARGASFESSSSID